MSSPAPKLAHVFNDDVLINEGDLQFVRAQFPKISHVLDHPLLRREFKKFEKEANRARQWVRLFGLGAVACSTFALLVLATKPLWDGWSIPPKVQYVLAAVEFAGMLGAIVGVGGLLLGAWKRRWLANRLMTERLRQWHFQFVIRHASEIENSCTGADAMTGFQKMRDNLLAQFLKAHHGKLDSQLESVVRDPLDRFAWLHEPSGTYTANSEVLRELFEAYEHLRLDHQYGYAVCKLSTTTDKPFWHPLQWPPNVQRALVSGAAAFCFIAALICAAVLVTLHFLAAIGHASSEPHLGQYVSTIALANALVGVALRTIHEGLGLDREIDRYREYRDRLALLRNNFKGSVDQNTRLRLMEELELAAVEEMRDFLRTHYDARFVLA